MEQGGTREQLTFGYGHNILTFSIVMIMASNQQEHVMLICVTGALNKSKASFSV